MYEAHLSDEDIKKFVSYHGTLKGEEGKDFIELSKNVNGHIRGCQECLDKVREAQREQDKIDDMEGKHVVDRSKHMRTVDENSDKIAEGLGMSKEEFEKISEVWKIGNQMHDKGMTDMEQIGIKGDKAKVSMEAEKAAKMAGEYLGENDTKKVEADIEKDKKTILGAVKKGNNHGNEARKVAENIEKDLGLEDIPSFTMHDEGQPSMGREDSKVLEEIAKRSKSGIKVEPKATEIMGKSTEGPNKTEAEKAAEMTEEYLKGKTDKGTGDLPKQIATADKEAILKESELMPIKKKGFKEWIKGLVDKLMGKGEK